MGLTVRCQTDQNLTVISQKRLFFTVNRQKCREILTVKTFQGISNLTLLARQAFAMISNHLAMLSILLIVRI